MNAVTLEEIHLNPGIIDRMLRQRKSVEILDRGKIAGMLVPASGLTRRSERGFPISKGVERFGAADVAYIEQENELR